MTSELESMMAEEVSMEEQIWRRWRMWWKDGWQIEEMCLCKERSESKIIPKFLADEVGEMILPEIDNSIEVVLERWWGDPIIRYSVLDGLRQRPLVVNKEWTKGRVNEIKVSEEI